jgi:hypothetical protein
MDGDFNIRGVIRYFQISNGNWSLPEIINEMGLIINFAMPKNLIKTT